MALISTLMWIFLSVVVLITMFISVTNMNMLPANGNAMRKPIKSKSSSKTQEELDAQLRILSCQLAEKEKLMVTSKTKIMAAESANPQYDHHDDRVVGLKEDLLTSELECSGLQDEINVIISRRKELQIEMMKQQEQYEFVTGMVKDLHKKEELDEEKHSRTEQPSQLLCPALNHNDKNNQLSCCREVCGSVHLHDDPTSSPSFDFSDGSNTSLPYIESSNSDSSLTLPVTALL